MRVCEIWYNLSMKTFLLAVVGLMLTPVFAETTSSWFRTEDAVCYPTAGVLNPDEGTVEVRVTPVCDLNSDIPAWPFAFRAIGADDATSTLMGLFHHPNSSFENPSYRFSALARTPKGPSYAIDAASTHKADETAVYAVVWKASERFTLYRNGQVIAQDKMRAPLRRLPPFFTVHDVSPFYADRVRVCTRALAADELQSDPRQPFVVTRDAALVANDLEKPVFALTPAFANRPTFAEPCAPVSSRILREDETFKMDFAYCNSGACATNLPVRIKVHARHRPDGVRQGGGLKRTLALPAHTPLGRTTLALGKLPAGYYEVSACGRDFRVCVVPKRESVREGALADWLGLASCRDAATFKACDIRWVRLWNDHELLWYQVEPRKGQFDFRTADRTVDACRKMGVNVLAVMGYPPDWASEKPVPRSDMKQPFKATCERWKPRNADEWRTYVRTTAEHFKGRVGMWEIYNEVNFHPPFLPASFSGTTAEYAKLLKMAAEEIHAAPVRGRVAVSGFGAARVADDAMSGDLLRMGAADWVDVWNMHAYGALGRGDQFRDELRVVSPKLPIWQSEFMWHVLRDPVRQAYLTALIHCHYLTLGYAKFFDFGWGEYLTDNKSSSPLEPLVAIAVQQHDLRACEACLGRVACLPTSDFDIAYAFRRTDGAYLTLVGSSCGDYRLEVSQKVLRAHDLFGRKLNGQDGAYDLHGTMAAFVTPDQLTQVKFVCTKPAELIANAGFEDLEGDKIAGLARCTPCNWQLRKQRDSAGEISITVDKPIAGRCSLRLNAPTPKGDVYAFSTLHLSATGRYRFKATVRATEGTPCAYLTIFDQHPPGKLMRGPRIQLAENETREIVFDFTLEEVPKGTVAAIVGVIGSGAMDVDDVSLNRL